MQKRSVMLAILLTLLLSFALAPAAFAKDGAPPVGTTCPPGFELHHMHGEMDHEHHIGLDHSLNADDALCVKHLPNGLHVHIDNVIP